MNEQGTTCQSQQAVKQNKNNDETPPKNIDKKYNKRMVEDNRMSKTKDCSTQNNVMIEMH